MVNYGVNDGRGPLLCKQEGSVENLQRNAQKTLHFVLSLGSGNSNNVGIKLFLQCQGGLFPLPPAPAWYNLIVSAQQSTIPLLQSFLSSHT